MGSNTQTVLCETQQNSRKSCVTTGSIQSWSSRDRGSLTEWITDTDTMYLFTYSPTFFKPAPIERPASPGPSPPSKSLVLRLFLCFLLPSILSTNAIQDGDWLGSLGWIKYFVVLSVLLVLESVLDHVSMLQTRPWVSTSYKLFKLVLIVWCLAPTQYNGSHLTYTHILAPIFHLSKNVVLYLTDVTLVVIDTVLAGTVTGLHILVVCSDCSRIFTGWTQLCSLYY